MLGQFEIELPVLDLPFDFNFSSKKDLTFTEFIQEVNPKFVFYPYIKKIIIELEKVVNGEIDRLMIFMPPRYGKSELVSRLLPAYFLYRHPEKWVGVNSYGAELSYSFSRIARENYLMAGGQLKHDAATIKHWETLSGGGLWAAGVGGPITGKGFHLGIIDDPVKNAEEAQSYSIQTRNNQWFDSVFSTREEPDGAIIVCQTRWNKRDLTGYILDKEIDEPEYWRIIHYEAIKSDTLPDYPDTCKVMADDRQVGEALNPLRYALKKLKKIKRRLGNYFWSALYQQNPSAKEGRVYHGFSEPGPDSRDIDLNNATGLYHSHDFGAVNHVWGIWAKIGEKFYLIYSEKLQEGTTQARANYINKKLAKYNIPVIAGYGGAGSEKQQRIDFIQAGLKIRLPGKKKVRQSDEKGVEHQIDIANKMLQNGDLVICSDQLQVIDQLDNCVRDDKEGIVDKATWHYLDMIRYMAAGINKGGWTRGA